MKWRGCQAGFSVVEVLLAATVFGFLVTALIGALVYGRSATASAGDHERAVYLAEEGVEAARNMSNQSFDNLADGTYGLTQSGGQWVLSGSSDTTDIFTRQVIIAASSTNRKTITSKVTWTGQGGGLSTVTLVSELTNWAMIARSWNNAILAGSADATGTNDAIKVDVSGNYAYVVVNSTTNNFLTVDISNPAAPSIVKTTTIAGTPTNITISGSYAYVTNQSDTAELQVVSIANPLAPSVVASVNMAGTGDSQSVAIVGTYAYVARVYDRTSGAYELTIVNVSNPLSPTVTGGYDNKASMNGVYVSGNYAYVATSSGSAEMAIIDVSNRASPALVKNYNASGSAAAQTVMGYGTVVLLAQGSTLISLDISSPTSPSQLGSFAASSTINKIDVDSSHTHAFLATSDTASEFQVIDISSLSAMFLARAVDVSGTTSTIMGLAYNSQNDTVVAASASDTQEVIIFTKN